MTNEALFAAGLGLPSPWRVVRSEFSAVDPERPTARALQIDIEVDKGTKFPCPCCQELCSIYDTVPKQWRHLDFWQHTTVLCSHVPRVRCSQGGTKMIPVPWAREGSGFTLLFEAFTVMLAREMAVSAVADVVGEHDTRLWRVVRHYVDKAHAQSSWSEVDTLAVDEVSTKKGHRYATVVIDANPPDDSPAKLLFMTEGKTADCVGEFAAQMPAHGAEPEQVKRIAMDMGKAYQAGAKEFFPEAKISFDRFHVMQLAGKAIDRERIILKTQGTILEKGALWALRGNEENLTDNQRSLRERLCAEHATLGRALALKDFLRETWECDNRAEAETHLKKFCAWAQRSRLPSFVKLARTIRSHTEGILGFFPGRLTSAAIEAINGILQLAKRRARGFRNFKNFRAIAYWMAGRLDIAVPTH